VQAVLHGYTEQVATAEREGSDQEGGALEVRYDIRAAVFGG
jgi:hypothetical protein